MVSDAQMTPKASLGYGPSHSLSSNRGQATQFLRKQTLETQVLFLLSWALRGVLASCKSPTSEFCLFAYFSSPHFASPLSVRWGWVKFVTPSEEDRGPGRWRSEDLVMTFPCATLPILSNSIQSHSGNKIWSTSERVNLWKQTALIQGRCSNNSVIQLQLHTVTVHF